MPDSHAYPSPAAVPSPSDGFQLEELDGELLLFNPHDGRLLELNSTAALVWQLCDGRRSVAEIAALLGDAFPADAPAIRADVPRLLSGLAALGALTWR